MALPDDTNPRSSLPQHPPPAQLVITHGIDPAKFQENLVGQCAVYDEYLDAQVTETDQFFLVNDDLCRQLVALGLRGLHDPINEQEFHKRKRVLAQQHDAHRNKLLQYQRVMSRGINYDDTSCDAGRGAEPVLRCLQEREIPNRSGAMRTILFIRQINDKGQEVSSYIDYSHRLETEDWSAIFRREKKIKCDWRLDLSFYNWSTMKTVQYSNSNHFMPKLDTDGGRNGIVGLRFVSKDDWKILQITPWPKKKTQTNVIRIELDTTDYLQVVLFDHYIGRFDAEEKRRKSLANVASSPLL